MADDFASPKSMLRRAKTQIAELDAQIKSFTKDEPWAHVVEKDSDGVTNLHKIKFTDRLSDDLPHIVFEAANNLRAVLDQLGFAVAQLAGNPEPKSCKFPFGPTEVDMRNNSKGGCKDLPAEIRTLFEGFNAYSGGNNALWALNELANGPKHKTLYPVALGSAGMFARNMSISGNFSVPAIRYDSANNEIVFLRVGLNAKVSYDVNVAFSVALDNVAGVVNGQHPVAALDAMRSEVESVLMATEAECRRIGLVQ